MVRKSMMVSAAVLLAVLLFGPGAAEASPSRYLYEVCDSALPEGGTPDVKFAHNPEDAIGGANSCAQPSGSLWISTTGPIGPTFAYWSVEMPAPAGARVESLRVTGGFCPGGTGTWGFEIENFRPYPNWPDGVCVELYRVFQGSYGGGVILLGCNSSCAAGAVIFAHYLTTTVVDESPPVVSELGGSLLGGGPQRGHQSLSATVSDKGGGLSEEAVLVNGVTAVPAQKESCATIFANNPSVYGTVATRPTPCPTAHKLSWNLDTQAYPFRDGANSVQVCGFDFATLNDPNRGCSAPQSVQVDNSCTPSPVDGGELLSAQFEGSNAETYTAGYGKGATLSGRLTTNADDPIAGATLCVKEATIGIDRSPSPAGQLTTDANGDFSYEVKPGADRQIVIGYRHDSRQVARDVRFYSRVRPSLKLAPAKLLNGQTVHLWGQLPGPRPERRVVVMQANTPRSKRWITFRKATTDDSGVFKAHYRFSSTTRRIRYRFRAIVPTQDSYPYVGGRSKAAAVLVRP